MQAFLGLLGGQFQAVQAKALCLAFRCTGVRSDAGSEAGPGDGYTIGTVCRDEEGCQPGGRFLHARNVSTGHSEMMSYLAMLAQSPIESQREDEV